MSRRDIEIAGAGGRPDFAAWVYRSERFSPIGALLVAPGLHFLGPPDPRMDRFCRILADAGLLVMSPFIRDFMALRAIPSALSDFECAFASLLSQPDLPPCRPGLFSISFGSLLALRLAASPKHRDAVGGVVIFGGYADWEETARFILTGEIADGVRLPFDPLSAPAVLVNLLEDIPGAPADPQKLVDLWLRFADSTWRDPAAKIGDRYRDIARAMADELPPEQRELFLVGCGAEPGAWELCRPACERRRREGTFLDPLPHLDGLRCPVHIIHGVDDDVIPYVQAKKLANAMPGHVRTGVHITGLYGHTESTGDAKSAFRALLSALGETRTSLASLRAMVGAATAR